MKRICLFLLVMHVCLAHAQQGYWFQGKFIELESVKSHGYYVQLKSNNISTPNLKSIIKDKIKSEIVIPITDCGFLIKTKEAPINEDIFVSDIYKSSCSDFIIILPSISFEINKGCSASNILEKYHDVISLKAIEGAVYRLDCHLPTSKEILELASLISKEKDIKWCEPVKMSNWRTTNTLYNKQYYLKNTGQNNGMPGIDINVEPAWNIVEGNSNITVAVIDEGIDFDHEDMANCIVNGYTVGNPIGYGIPQATYLYEKGHGVACAGIIGAENNQIGIRGVASGVKLLPVNIVPDSGYYDNYGVFHQGFASDSDIGKAIVWASQRADVLSCSWGGGSYSQDIVNAIDTARTFGRGGKGCIVIFSSGNDYDNGRHYVNFPANVDGVLTVGAIDNMGYVWNYSQRGAELDLVAPSGNGNSSSDIVTTDRMGNIGYQISGNWNYYENFGGTSAACPQVAGVAALMLSSDPNLTEQQVRNVLKKTCRNLSGYTYNEYRWNSDVGYGLVDAGAAVSCVASYIFGDNSVYDHEVYSVEHLVENMSVAWSLSGLNSSCFILEEDVPSANRCRLSRIDGAEFIGSASLTLTAHIIYNGDTIKTLTKHLTAPYIDCPTVPCDHAVYSVVSRPENSTVAWETNGHGLGYDLDPNGLLPEDTTAHVIIPSDGEDIWGTLTANVIVDGDTVGVLSKYIDSSGGFFGTWYQEPTSLDSTNAVPQGFSHMSLLGMVSNRKVYLVSDDFIDATITHSQNGVLVRNWSNSNGVISFTPWASIGDGVGMVTVNGSYPNSCRHFRFFLTLPQQPLPPLLLSASPSGGAWQFALSEREGAERSDDSRTALPTDWQLTVIKSDTGRAVYDGHVSGTSATVSTIGWLPGVYVAVAFVDGQYISSKFVVSK